MQSTIDLRMIEMQKYIVSQFDNRVKFFKTQKCKEIGSFRLDDVGDEPSNFGFQGNFRPPAQLLLISRKYDTNLNNGIPFNRQEKSVYDFLKVDPDYAIVRSFTHYLLSDGAVLTPEQKKIHCRIPQNMRSLSPFKVSNGIYGCKY